MTPNIIKYRDQRIFKIASTIIYGLLLLPFIASCASTPSHLEIAKEYPKPNEAQTTQGLVDSLTQSIAKRYAGETVLRDAHPKHHGCVRATLSVPELPPQLQVGLFSQEGEYASWIRYSTATETVESDAQKAMLGMAIKVLGVEGEKLLSDERHTTTQDILLLSHPVLPIRNAEDFLEAVEEKVWFFVNPFDLHLHELRIALDSRKHHSSPLDIRYWSTTPYLFGEGRAIKYSAKPCSASATTKPTPLTDHYLRDTMSQQLASGAGCFDLMVQFQTNANTMPIEDASIVWNEATSPFQKVAQIRISQQTFESNDQMEFCENISMTPWHSLPEHRPLGSINRARKDVYREISKFRHEQNEAKREEPNN